MNFYSADYLLERRTRYALKKRNYKMHKRMGKDGRYYYAILSQDDDIKDISPEDYCTLEQVAEWAKKE